MNTTLSLRALRNEFAKMRHLRIGAVVALLLGGGAALTVAWAMGSGLPDHRLDADGYGWRLLMVSLHSSAMLVAPVLLAVAASRQVEIEHSGGGWWASAAAGAAPGRLCRAKLLALGLLVTPVPAVWGAIVAALGTAIGIAAPFPAARLVGLVVSLMVIDLAVLAVQLLASARADNQLGPLALGIIGTLLGLFSQIMPAWVRCLSPWTAYGLVAPADFVGEDLVDLDAHPGLLAALAVAGTALLLAVTARLDRREV